MMSKSVCLSCGSGFVQDVLSESGGVHVEL